jgi:hypothetical protein
LIRAAKYLQVAPWELAERPIWWMNVALAGMAAEAAAERAQAARTKRHQSK